jgi:hypothetical protein
MTIVPLQASTNLTVTVAPSPLQQLQVVTGR